MNSFSISATLNHPEAPAIYKDAYCYDEPSLGIIAEPLVHITTTTIQQLLAAKPVQVNLNFSTEVQDDWTGVVVQLTFIESDVDGSTYQVNPVGDKFAEPLPVWLCARLTDYFSEPPQTFYCSINY